MSSEVVRRGMDRGKLGKAFHDMRVLMEKNQQEIADEAGISRMMYYSIEKNRSFTTVETAARIARALLMKREAFVDLWVDIARDEAVAAYERSCA